MVVRLQIRHDIKSEWELYNPVLASGELGIETDNAEGQRIKIGDGNRAWIDLPFIDDKSVHKYADEEIYGNKIFHNSLLLRQGAEIPEGQILNGLADSASKDDEGNIIKDYYQPKIVVLDEITNETNWNTLVKEGIYKVNIDTWGTASTLHGPNEYIGNIYSKGILCVHANQGFVTQVYYPYMESPIVYRNYNDVEWQTWGSISNLDRTIVHTTGDETIAGNKTFSNNVVLNNGNINFNLVGDALILKGGEPFIKKSTDNDTYLSASEGGSIHFRPNGDTSVEGEIIIDNQGIIQGKVTQDGAGNVITDTYARKDQMEQIANNEGLTAIFLGRNLLDNPSGYTEIYEMKHSTSLGEFVDKIKIDSFTIIGSPTITNGVLSNCSDGNYIDFTSVEMVNTVSKDQWEIISPLVTVKNLEGTQGVFAIFTDSTHKITMSQVNGTFNYGIRLDESISNYSTFECELDKSYQTRIIFNNGVYTFYHKIYGEDWTNDGTFEAANIEINESMQKKFGVNEGDNFNNTNLIDLNAFKFSVDNEIVYHPCLYIPYNLTASGVKVSDVLYKDRIEDCYTEFSTANYFIIDEINEMYQIPYDTPDGHCVTLVYKRNGINSYEYNTNLECTQTGSCTANTEFTFSIPYANDQYALSCPYSVKSRTGFTPTVTGDFISKGLIFLSDTQ